MPDPTPASLIASPRTPGFRPGSHLAICLGLCFGLIACGSAEPGGRNILIITLDTTRADHVGAYGSTLGVTPNVDALALAGVVFEEVYAPMPQTLPAHATMFTGLPPRLHGALENTYRLDPGIQTLAELVADQGYATGAFVAAKVLDQETGIHQGFEAFDLPGGRWNAEREGHPPQRSAEEVTSAALAWADGLDDQEPYLLWAHYYDPHGDKGGSFDVDPEQLAAVSRPRVRAELRKRAQSFRDSPLPEPQLAAFWQAYAASIRYMDEHIGRLLEGLREQGLLENTLIVVVGDHGEGLYQHGIKAHGVYIWEEQMKVPLIVVHPDGLAAGTRVAGRALLKDLHPTILGLALDRSLDGEGGEHGQDPSLGIDLWARVQAGTGLPERPVFMERPHYDRERVKRRLNGVQIDKQDAYGFLTAVLHGDDKLILHPNGDTLLFDLSADEAELVDRAAMDPVLTGRLEGLLRAWMEGHPVGPPGEDLQLSPEKLKVLRELGYLGGGPGASVADADPGPDPEDGGGQADDG